MVSCISQLGAARLEFTRAARPCSRVSIYRVLAGVTLRSTIMDSLDTVERVAGRDPFLFPPLGSGRDAIL
jgi:hypothetical protein